ncbi:MAG TPA: hypothetical protein VFN72_14490 [Solirubrobacterales bacterium]|nr:hypothetical protein [Solirubrobacterales bacterium]
MSQDRDAKKPLVELAPEETTLPALSQSAHPVEFIEANGGSQPKESPMDRKPEAQKPLVELAPEESVLPALQQSAHPVEFIEANETREDDASEQDAS